MSWEEIVAIGCLPMWRGFINARPWTDRDERQMANLCHWLFWRFANDDPMPWLRAEQRLAEEREALAAGIQTALL